MDPFPAGSFIDPDARITVDPGIAIVIETDTPGFAHLSVFGKYAYRFGLYRVVDQHTETGTDPELSAFILRHTIEIARRDAIRKASWQQIERPPDEKVLGRIIFQQ